MPLWIIEPHDPLIVRDGKPFGPNPGARAHSLPFPFPSTTTGGLRNRVGPDQHGNYTKEHIQHLKKIAVRGPLLVELEQTTESTPSLSTWLVPSPADALLLESEPQSPATHQPPAIRKRLVPLRPPEHLETNLPAASLLVGQVQHSSGKPQSNAPRFWYWHQFERWLCAPPIFEDTIDAASLGYKGLEQDTRMHVSLDRTTQTAREGALFQTRGLEFTLVPKSDHGSPSSLSNARRLALGVIAEKADFDPCLAALGGERRMVAWRSSTGQLPACSDTIIQQVGRDRACRVVLLTPACFTKGWCPTWLLEPRAGVQPTLQAVAVGRPQVVSGWDFEHGRPKPTRRLAPAGSVFFVTLSGEDTAISDWIQSIWMQNISDTEQDRHDGFGLAVLGIWDGQPQEQQMKGDSNG